MIYWWETYYIIQIWTELQYVNDYVLVTYYPQ